MLRLLSVLLLLGGLLVAGYAGSVLMEDYLPRDTAQLEAAEEIAAMETAPAEPIVRAPMAENAPAPEAAPRVSRSLSFGDDLAVGLESADATLQPSSTESFVESLKSVPVAHETPERAEYKRAFDVTLAIDATGDDTATDALRGQGRIVDTEALVSEKVDVRLTGANFEITPNSPGVQVLSPLTENTWRWSVRPVTAGNHDLVFEIFAIDEDSVVPLRTFRDTVTVEVSGLNRAVAFADQANPLFVLLGGIGSAIGGLVGLARFFGKR